MSHSMIQSAKHIGDVTMIGSWLAHAVGWISLGIVPVLTMIWLLLRIWETDTVQGWRKKRKKKE